MKQKPKNWSLCGGVGLLACSMVWMGAMTASSAKESTDMAVLLYGKKAPGAAKGEKKGSVYTLSNDHLTMSWLVEGGKLQPQSFSDVLCGKVDDCKGREAFGIGVEEAGNLNKVAGFVPVNVKASEFVVQGNVQLSAIKPDSKAVKAADRVKGWRLSAVLKHEVSGVTAHWQAELRDGAHYVRQTLKLEGDKGKLVGIQGLDLPIQGAKNAGTATAGNPAVSDHLFMGLEQPMAVNDFSQGVAGGLKCNLPLKAGVQYEVSSVVGTYPEGQMRRAFLTYLEKERAAPYRQFLHYNGWFDFDRNVTEQGTIDTIKAYDQEMMKKRGVQVKAFVIDDGWDDWDAGFWAINKKKFPNDFKAVGSELTKVNSRFGIWISPLAGYAHADTRIGHAAKAGLTPNGQKSLDLSYQPYYDWFLNTTSKMVKEDKVAYFKFDKAGSGVNPHFLALLRICKELRKLDPELVVNITVGTWPSPFWLNHIDCTWREGNDMGYEGPGNDREKWITYRDAQTWRGVVSKGPLYPLNSIMNHGICLSDGHPFPKRALNGGTDMRHEVRTFFGSGTLMQELYVKPAITPQESWDQIAEAAKWSKANADVLVDTHWVGGNPSNGAEVYGWAAWSPKKGVLTLRNPSDQERVFKCDIQKIFELPASAEKVYSVKSAYADTPAPIEKAAAGTEVSITLPPFGVQVLEFTPKK